MNGRLYDPELGRMLSPDPYVQVPEYSQNFNRYSYVLNNPLNLTDPTGFNWFGKAIGWLKNNWRTVVVIVVAAILVCTGWGATIALGIYGALGGGVVAATSLAGYVITGAFIGAVTGGLGAALNGGNMGDVLRGAVIGGISGALTGALHGTSAVVNIAGHGVVGGASNVAMGGKFGDGFLSAAASAATAVTGLTDPETSPLSFAGRTAVASIAGGTGSALGGGKFSNGAVTGAMTHLLNAESGTMKKAYDAWKRLQSWKAGTAPMIDYHGPGSSLSDGLKNSNGAECMRQYYYNSGKQNIDNYDYRWPNSALGAWRILRAGFDGAEQFVGSWQNGSIERSGDTLFFMIEAPTTNESYYRPETSLLGLARPGNVMVGPQRNIMNIIWWTEKYNPIPYRPAAETLKPAYCVPMGY
jgi:hypothetical protein